MGNYKVITPTSGVINPYFYCPWTNIKSHPNMGSMGFITMKKHLLGECFFFYFCSKHPTSKCKKRKGSSPNRNFLGGAATLVWVSVQNLVFQHQPGWVKKPHAATLRTFLLAIKVIGVPARHQNNWPPASCMQVRCRVEWGVVGIQESEVDLGGTFMLQCLGTQPTNANGAGNFELLRPCPKTCGQSDCLEHFVVLLSHVPWHGTGIYPHKKPYKNESKCSEIYHP